MTSIANTWEQFDDPYTRKMREEMKYFQGKLMADTVFRVTGTEIGRIESQPRTASDSNPKRKQSKLLLLLCN